MHDLVDDVRIGSLFATVETFHGPPPRGREHPFMQSHATLADRVLEALARSRDVAVKRDCNVAGHEAHGVSSKWSVALAGRPAQHIGDADRHSAKRRLSDEPLAGRSHAPR